MTIYEKIIKFTEEEMVQFLLVFARETIDQFGNFQLPSEDVIREFLNRSNQD